MRSLFETVILDVSSALAEFTAEIAHYSIISDRVNQTNIQQAWSLSITDGASISANTSSIG